MADDLSLFDANAMTGRPRRLPDPVPWTDRPLGGLLDEFGIAEALVWHIEAKEVEAIWGNERLLEVTAADPRLHPVWTVLPHHTGEMPAPDGLCQRLRQTGARAVTLFPKTHSWSLDDWCAGPLLSALESRRIPVLLDQDEATPADIAGVLAAHPDLRLILIGGTYRNGRLLFPLFARYEHLYLEVSGYQWHGAVAETAARYPARLLFGSRMPLYSPGSAIANVTYADVTEDERRRIAGGTLRQLLAESQL